MASDEALIAAYRAGDETAWREIHRRYHRLVRSIATSYGLIGTDVDEIEQVTFSILVSSIERIQPDSRLAAWLATVARRHTWRLLEARRREVTADVAPDAAMHNDVADHASRLADEEVLRTALAALPSKCRTLIEALYLRGHDADYASVSSELNMPIGSIGPTRGRCLDRLRELIDAATTERPHDMEVGR